MSTVRDNIGTFKAIVIGGSAGSFQLVNKLLASLNTEFSIPLIICLHRLRDGTSAYKQTLSHKSVLPVIEPEDATFVRSGNVYIAPSNFHLEVTQNYQFLLSSESPVNNSKPAIDITMTTAASVYQNELLGILLTGASKDGSAGMKAIQESGGYTIVQDPDNSDFRYMPESALKLIKPDQVLTFEKIVEFLNKL